MLCQPFPCCVCIFHSFLELPCSWILCPITKIPVASAGRISPAGKPHSSAACFPLVGAKKWIWFYFYFLFFAALQCRTRREGKGKDINKIYRDTDPVEAKDKKNLISHTNSWAVKKEKKRKETNSWAGTLWIQVQIQGFLYWGCWWKCADWWRCVQGVKTEE